MKHEITTNRSQKAQEWLTVYVQPFLYGAITRLPFIYFVIHMRFTFEMNWNHIGVAVGSYQAMRVVTSVASMVCPRWAHALGTAASLVGNSLVLRADPTDETQIIVGTVMVGFAETFAAMQTYVKGQFGAQLEQLEYKLKLQYAAVMVGVTVAFSLGGGLYQFFGMDGVAWMGALLSGLELLALAAFLVYEGISKSQSDEYQHGNVLDMTQHPQSSDEDEEVASNSNSQTHQPPPTRSKPPKVDKEEGVPVASEHDEQEVGSNDKEEIQSEGHNSLGQNFMALITSLAFEGGIWNHQPNDRDGNDANKNDQVPPENLTSSLSPLNDDENDGQELGGNTLLEKIASSSSLEDEKEQEEMIIFHDQDKDKEDSEAEIRSSNDQTNCLQVITEALNTFSESGMGATYLNYTLCLTFGMEAITIGYNLAVSPVYILDVFGRNTTVIGILLASGAGFGTAVSIAIALSKRGKECMETWLPSPTGFLVAMGGISFAVMVAAIPVFPIHVVGLMFLMGFNDLAALLLNEMQGAITSSKAYRTLGPLGQVVRRSGNVVTAVTGPILFGILPQLPYIVAGTITLSWTVILTLVIRHRARHSRRIVLDHGAQPESVSNFFASTTFAHKEVLARQVKRGHMK